MNCLHRYHNCQLCLFKKGKKGKSLPFSREMVRCIPNSHNYICIGLKDPNIGTFEYGVFIPKTARMFCFEIYEEGGPIHKEIDNCNVKLQNKIPESLSVIIGFESLLDCYGKNASDELEEKLNEGSLINFPPLTAYTMTPDGKILTQKIIINFKEESNIKYVNTKPVGFF